MSNRMRTLHQNQGKCITEIRHSKLVVMVKIRKPSSPAWSLKGAVSDFHPIHFFL